MKDNGVPRIIRRGKNDPTVPRGMICVNMLARLKTEHAITDDLKKLHKIRDSAISMWRDVMSYEVEVKNYGNTVGAYSINSKGQKVLCFLMVLYTAKDFAKLIKARDAILAIETAKRLEEQKDDTGTDSGSGVGDTDIS